MKNTLITLSSVVALAGAADAQVYDNVRWVATDTNLSDGAGSGNMTAFIGGALVNVGTYDVKINKTSNLSSGPTFNGQVVDWNVGNTGAGALSFTITTNAVSGYKIIGMDVYGRGQLDGSNYDLLTGNGVGWSLVDNVPYWDQSNGNYANGSSFTSSYSGIVGFGASGFNFAGADATTFTVESSGGSGFENVHWDAEVIAVPEPSSTALLGLGALGLLARRKR